MLKLIRLLRMSIRVCVCVCVCRFYRHSVRWVMFSHLPFLTIVT